MVPDRLETIRDVVEPVVTPLGLEIYDLELAGPRGPPDPRPRRGGVDLDTLEAVSRRVAPLLEALDELSGPYTLEVSSPGLERPLRTPRALPSARSARWSRSRPAATPASMERVRGVLIGRRRRHDHHPARRRLTERSLSTRSTQARTVFEWGPAPKPGNPRRQARPRREGRSGTTMNSDMMEALENIEREKGISVEIMLEALANALVTAYKRMPDAAEEALVEIDVETGDIHVIAQELDEDGKVVTRVGRHARTTSGASPRRPRSR